MRTWHPHRAPPPRRAALWRRLAGALLLVASGSAIGSAQPPVASPSPSSPPPHDEAAGGLPGGRLALLSMGIVAAATGNQVIGSPSGWARTGGGYAARLGDQVGFAIVEESVRAGWTHAVGWSADTRPCAWQRPGGDGRATLGRRLACAGRRSVVLLDHDGGRHANWPLFAGVATASVTSLAWRPERARASTAATMVVTRIAVVLGATYATQLVSTWWEER